MSLVVACLAAPITVEAVPEVRMLVVLIPVEPMAVLSLLLTEMHLFPRDIFVTVKGLVVVGVVLFLLVIVVVVW